MFFSVLAQKVYAAGAQLVHTYVNSRLPSIVLMDGITLGAAVGVSMALRERVCTERTVVALPEASIGKHCCLLMYL